MNSAVITPCSHFFHAGCLKKWLYVQETCPLCHAQLKSQSPAASVPADSPPANQNPGGQGDAAACNDTKDETAEKERDEEEDGPSAASSSSKTNSHQTTTEDGPSSSSTPDTLDTPSTSSSLVPASTWKQSSSQMTAESASPLRDQLSPSERLAGHSEECSPPPCSLWAPPITPRMHEHPNTIQTLILDLS